MASAAGVSCSAGLVSVAAHRAEVPAGAEPVEVFAPRPQAPQLHVHRVRGLDPGVLDAAGYYRAHARVLRHFPRHRDVARRHPAQAVPGHRVHRQPGPDHEAVRPRLAGGDAEQERIGAETGVVRGGNGDGGTRPGGDEPGPEAGGKKGSARNVVHAFDRYGRPVGPVARSDVNARLTA